MELKVINDQGQEAAKLQASDVLFGREFNEALVHQVVTAYQANARAGNRQQKDRSEVRHTTTKPWRQKGTGRARAGSNGSPLWRGGGRIFPNSPEENFSQKVNKKMFRAGMAAILSELNRQERLVIVDALSVDAPKTKLFAEKLKNMGLDQNLLVITGDLTENLYLSSRNLPNVLVLEAQEADPVSLVRFPKVLVTKDAVAKFEEMWV
ncbi:MAG TPA: 50S ribosomal protein L4 [Rhodocyclaceae bacterium]|jgi:large subunit ribosomal protein L4|nr:50S ribosomal protein L4 [Rhodocyclaceae bacterium]HMV22551.1 50S ribosomal protein L4 [Rhodocyclaceae bacterium]HMW78275.1 50S ribosomal protein L4 [Rhodocyclaceae bacterium]HNL22398.1 50S ribosomal protein L4 [Rhodocyclaceae bacterium]HNM82775.1 50S ribosomal protein L4 [Rhodocyclaceae bacterium]